MPPEKNFKIFLPRLKKIKTRNRTDQHDKENDTETQQGQWFTDTDDRTPAGNSGFA
ncbi:MAG: hypothetical protein O9340_15645 [Cyclobacteriaceae bacterium]|nr:hypothetical protein [Cyclobacteriaceae bacterium]